MVGEAETLEHAHRAVPTFGLVQICSGQRQFDVLTHRRHDDLSVGVGEDESDAASNTTLLLRGVETIDDDGPGVGDDERVDHPRQRRLSAAVGAHDADASFGKVDRDITQHSTTVE
ncbi:Uncharacterised protein [Mycobacteroides abscessus subsp. abscessus]|nr:Uncharacterised protein [Mycobacteroides abscessus subsp. abscessus]